MLQDVLDGVAFGADGEVVSGNGESFDAAMDALEAASLDATAGLSWVEALIPAVARLLARCPDRSAWRVAPAVDVVRAYLEQTPSAVEAAMDGALLASPSYDLWLLYTSHATDPAYLAMATKLLGAPATTSRYDRRGEEAKKGESPTYSMSLGISGR